MAALRALHPDREARGYSQKRTNFSTRKKYHKRYSLPQRVLVLLPPRRIIGISTLRRLAGGLDLPHTGMMTTRIALLIGAVVVAASMRPAAAQFGMPGIDFAPDRSRQYTPEEKEKMQQIDKDYKATMKKVPDKKHPYDPWAGARDTTPTKQGQR